jgi:hypothetical protein
MGPKESSILTQDRLALQVLQAQRRTSIEETMSWEQTGAGVMDHSSRRALTQEIRKSLKERLLQAAQVAL